MEHVISYGFHETLVPTVIPKQIEAVSQEVLEARDNLILSRGFLELHHKQK